MSEYREMQVLQVIDIKQLLGISYTKANRILNDIKDEYNIKDVMFYHLKKYYNIRKF